MHSRLTVLHDTDAGSKLIARTIGNLESDFGPDAVIPDPAAQVTVVDPVQAFAGGLSSDVLAQSGARAADAADPAAADPAGRSRLPPARPRHPQRACPSIGA